MPATTTARPATAYVRFRDDTAGAFAGRVVGAAGTACVREAACAGGSFGRPEVTLCGGVSGGGAPIMIVAENPFAGAAVAGGVGGELCAGASGGLASPTPAAAAFAVSPLSRVACCPGPSASARCNVACNCSNRASVGYACSPCVTIARARTISPSACRRRACVMQRDTNSSRFRSANSLARLCAPGLFGSRASSSLRRASTASPSATCISRRLSSSRELTRTVRITVLRGSKSAAWRSGSRLASSCPASLSSRARAWSCSASAARARSL